MLNGCHFSKTTTVRTIIGVIQYKDAREVARHTTASAVLRCIQVVMRYLMKYPASSIMMIIVKTRLVPCTKGQMVGRPRKPVYPGGLGAGPIQSNVGSPVPEQEVCDKN
jgi:hypothetical protein